MPVDLIYHYTGLKGLMGIVEMKNLWATDVRYLNDTSESTFGREKVDELLRRDIQFRTRVPAPLIVLRDSWLSFPFERLFVTCFCTNGDLLNQWRGYGRLGYSIGFDRATLSQLGRDQKVEYVLREMVYSDTERVPAIKLIVDQFLAATPELMNAMNFSEMTAAQKLAAIMPWGLGAGIALYELQSRFKHSAFEEEREVRAIHTVDRDEPDGIELRETALGPTPYVRLPVGETPQTTAIREVRVGPTPHKAEARTGVVDLLKRWGLPDVRVHNSEIPFRW